MPYTSIKTVISGPTFGRCDLSVLTPFKFIEAKPAKLKVPSLTPPAPILFAQVLTLVLTSLRERSRTD